jgi:hypothetical protein
MAFRSRKPVSTRPASRPRRSGIGVPTNALGMAAGVAAVGGLLSSPGVQAALETVMSNPLLLAGGALGLLVLLK